MFEPPFDPVFRYLDERIVQGALPLYAVDAPLDLIKPYSLQHRPNDTEEGKKVLEAMVRDFRAGKFHPSLWVYPKGNYFVLSDDYFSLFTHIVAGSKIVRCEVMGEPTVKGISNINYCPILQQVSFIVVSFV